MPDSKQLRILKKLVTLLEGINPDNDDPATGDPYVYDLRGKVFRGRSILTVDNAEDCISILEFPRQEQFTLAGDGTIRRDDWLLMLQGWPKDDPEHPSDPAYQLLAAVEQRLSRIAAENGGIRGGAYPDDYMLGKVGDAYELSSFTLTPGVVRPPEDAMSRLAMFYMPLALGVKVNMTNPY